VEKAARVLGLLGFDKTYGNGEQGWLSLQNENGFSISLIALFSCPHLFYNPSLSYFNGKEGKPKVILQIRDLKIPITEEITAFNNNGIVHNIIIRDPGGLGFFVFND
jgi:hypothetical protein